MSKESDIKYLEDNGYTIASMKDFSAAVVAGDIERSISDTVMEHIINLGPQGLINIRNVIVGYSTNEYLPVAFGDARRKDEFVKHSADCVREYFSKKTVPNG